LEAAVQRHHITPLTWTTTKFKNICQRIAITQITIIYFVINVPISACCTVF
jgi:hypothetical protein